MRAEAFRRALGVLALGLVLAPATAGAGWRQEPDELPGPLADSAPEPPWLVPDPPSPGVAPTFEEQVLQLVNQERWADGQRPPLKGQTQLAAAAELHSVNMGTRNFFGHCDLDTATLPGTRMTAAGYIWNAAGENIAAGYTDPAAVMAGWMASTGHRNNILNTGYRELGVGYHLDAGDLANVRNDLNTDCVAESTGNGPYFRYWTQNFGRRDNVYPLVIDREAHSTASQNVDLYLYGAGWASEMRIRNSPGAFGPWEPFSSNRAWQLTAGGGLKTVIAEIRNFAGGTVRTASDTILLDQPLNVVFADGFEAGNTSSWSDVVP